MTDILSYRHWAVSQDFANSVGLIALRTLAAGRSIDHLIHKKTIEDLAPMYNALVAASDGFIVSTEYDRESRLLFATTRNGQNVAIIPVMGGLTKRGDMCSYGMRDYIGMISKANANQKFSAIVLDVESPGGTVNGTNEFGMAVKQSKKPIVAFGDGMVASAAYWVASQAREIMANKNNATEFGSIGVLCMLENYQAYIQKEIGSVEILRAKQSIDKAKVNVIEPITDAQRAEIIDELSAIAKDFIKTVKAGRGARLNTNEENIFTGKMYDSKTALSMGMIDSLGTLQDAIDRAASLASAPSALKGQSAQSNTKTMSLKSKLISMIFGKSEKAEDEKPPTAEEIQAADAQAAEMEAELITLKEASVASAAKVVELQATVAEQIAQIKTLSDEKTALEAKVAEQKEALDKKPTGQLTTVIPGNGEASQAADGKEVKENKFRTQADEEADKYVAALPKNK